MTFFGGRFRGEQSPLCHMSQQPALLNSFIKALPPSRKGIQVLDLGSGYNRWAISMAELGYHVTAIDQSPQTVFHANLDFHQGDVVEWLQGLADDVQFDGIFMRYILHLFPHDVVVNELMPLLRKHLVPGGVMAIETFYLPPAPPFSEDHRHPSYWTTDQLWELMPDMKVCHEDEAPDLRLDMSGNERTFFSSQIVVKNVAA